MSRSLCVSRESIRNKGVRLEGNLVKTSLQLTKTEKPYIPLLVSGRISDMRVSAAASEGYL